MPRVVRPSYVEVQVDGLAKDFGSGPRSKDGHISAQFYVRNCGEVENSIKVYTNSFNNTHSLIVLSPEGDVIYEHKTDLDLTIPVRVKRKLIESGTP